MTRRHYPRALVVLQPTVQTFVAGGTKEIARVNIIPDRCSWTSNDVTQADTAEVRIPWRAMPLDPRLLVDCRMVLYLADVTDPRVDLDFTNERFACFMGFVDEHEVDAGKDGGWVRMTARDYSGPLMDVRWSNAAVRVDVPLKQSIQAVLAPLKTYSKIAIEVERTGPIKSITGRNLWTPPRGATLWEVITGLAQITGQVPDWRLGTLVIRTPQAITAEGSRRLAFGDKIDKVSLRKSANPLYNKQIKFRNLNTRTGRIDEGQWPAKVDGTREQIVVPMSSELSPAQLQALAKNVFETYARRHIAGSFETIAMEDDAGKPLVGADDDESPESATLRSGDSIFIDTRLGQRGLMFGQTQKEMEDFLVGGGMPRTEAREVVGTWMKADDVATLFSVRRAVHRMDAAGGYSLSVDFENVVSG